MKIRDIIVFLVVLAGFSRAQAPPLDAYIGEGLKNNLALQQKQFSLKQSMEALKEARAMFFPSLSIEARYSRAGGGRLIEFPVGDLMNPVYGSLNDLFRIHGIDTGFPTDIRNERFPFFRKKEQDTKLRLIQPLFQPALFYNYRIQSDLQQAVQAEIDAYKRQLIAEIKTAYFSHLKTLKVIELLDQARELLEENLRISRSLFENGKITEDVVFRAGAELSGLEGQMAEAEKSKILASQYFNFLINRDLHTPIRIEHLDLSRTNPVSLDAAIERALRKRDEFRVLRSAVSAAAHQIGLAGSELLPSLTAVIDYGIQGEQYRLGKEDDYWMASLVFQWTFYNGSRTQAKKSRAGLEKRRLELQIEELEKQIRLQVQEEYQNLLATEKMMSAAAAKEEAAARSLDIITKKVRAGTALQIEFLDARNTWTTASVQRISSEYEQMIALARFERVSAELDLDQVELKNTGTELESQGRPH